MPKVSIIITCYNYAHFLSDAINSALNQTYQDYEIIIVNDGSTDNTLEVLKKYQKNPKIKIINQENQGVSKARNLGIEKSVGEYILPLDADDMIHPEYLSKTAPILDKKQKIGIVYTAFQFFGDVNQVIQPIDFDFKVLAFHGNFMTTTSLFRKEAWRKAGKYNTNMKHGYEDWNLWIGICSYGWEAKLINEPLFYYRQHGVSRSDNVHQNYDLTIETIISNYPEIYNKLISEKDWFEFKSYFKKENRFPIGNLTTPSFEKYINNIKFNKIKNPKTSIIVIWLGKNTSAFDQTIKSALFQTDRNFEILIVSKNQNNSNIENIKKYQLNPRIRFIDQENINLSVVKNLGVSNAKGQYILFLYSNDLIHEKMLEYTVPILDSEEKIGFVYSDGISGNSNELISSLDFDFELLNQKNYISYCSLFRKKAWKNVGGYKDFQGESDWKFWLEICAQGWFGRHISMPLYYQRKVSTK